MPKKLKYLAFLLAISLLILLVLFIRPTKAFQFQNAKGDCAGRSIFMYNALYRDTASAEFVFFGSSRTMNDVNDSMMSANAGRRFLNLGYCRFGRNLDYFFVSEYCRLHHPKKIILEVREEEGDEIHALTPFFLTAEDIALEGKLLKPQVFADLYDKWLCNLKFTRGVLFGQKLPEPAVVTVRHGFWYGNKTTDIYPLLKKRLSDSIEYSRRGESEVHLNRVSHYYFEKLKALCELQNITLYFLYLPSYGNTGGLPEQIKHYDAYGYTFVPADSIVKDVLNYSDYGHLNKRGADKLSAWLLVKLDTF